MKKPQMDTDVGVSLAVSEARRSLGYTDNILFICVYLWFKIPRRFLQEVYSIHLLFKLYSDRF
jgi:hypothetical protein